MNNNIERVEKIKTNISATNEFLEEQIHFHESKFEQFKNNPNPYRSSKHQEVATKFLDLKTTLNFLYDLAITPKQCNRPNILSLTQEDLEGLPEEQIAELNITNSDRAEFTIQNIFENHSSGMMSIDQVIVSLYKETQEIQKRNAVTAKLYRMVQKGILFPVKNKKGIYTIFENDASQDQNGEEIKDE